MEGKKCDKSMGKHTQWSSMHQCDTPAPTRISDREGRMTLRYSIGLRWADIADVNCDMAELGACGRRELVGKRKKLRKGRVADVPRVET